MLTITIWLAFVASAAIVLCHPQIHFQSQPASEPLISSHVESYIDSLLSRHSSPGLAVAVVLKDPSVPNGFRHQLLGVGQARTASPPIPVTPDTLFAIASNSKLFLALSVGLLISDESLNIDWTTKVASIIPEWKLMDPIASQEATILDLLVHRTGMPRHDFAGAPLEGGIPEMVSNLRHLRPSAPFRSTFQYNNMMFETLSHLPMRLLNISFESFVTERIFKPLGMNSTTYNVMDALKKTYPLDLGSNSTKQALALAHGYQYSLRDFYANETGVLRPTKPYFQRPGEERIWAGAGGVLTSVRDMVPWLSALLNGGVIPHSNKTLIPPSVLERLETGVTVSQGKAPYPELSPKVYGPAQWRYSYRGHEIIEHGGNNPGFKTQVARFPNLEGKLPCFPNATGLGIAVFSNDADGGVVHESVKWRIFDDLLHLPGIDWYSRYVNEIETFYEDKRHAALPRPESPKPPPMPLNKLQNYTFSHPAYGVLKPCFVPEGFSTAAHTAYQQPPIPEGGDRVSACAAFLAHPTTQLLLNHTPFNDIPTLVVPFRRTFATHLRLTHWSGPWFNVSVVWGNQAQEDTVQHPESIEDEDGEGVMIGLDERFEVEWVAANRGGGEEEGLAFRGGIWGMEGSDATSPEGFGKEGAEVWFKRVD